MECTTLKSEFVFMWDSSHGSEYEVYWVISHWCSFLLLLIIYSSLLFSYLNTRSDYSHFLLGDFKILSFLSCSIMEEHRCLSVLLHLGSMGPLVLG